MAMIEYELPAVVSSTEQGLAFLAYAIDNQFGSKGFEAKLTPQWLTEGRTFKAYLPWEMEVAKAKAEAVRRPHCTVERDWLRLGLKTLGEKLEGQSSQGEVDFNFDGVFFSIGGPGPPLLLPATGEKPWPNSIRVRISKLTLLPRRIMSPHVAITIYPDSLKIDRVWIPRLPDPLPASSGDEN